jgi:hypothetical protein
VPKGRGPIDGRWLLGAVVPVTRKQVLSGKMPDGPTRMIYSDSGDDSLEDISKELLSAGCQPELVETLTRGSGTLSKARRTATELIRKARTEDVIVWKGHQIPEAALFKTREVTDKLTDEELAQLADVAMAYAREELAKGVNSEAELRASAFEVLFRDDQHEFGFTENEREVVEVLRRRGHKIEPTEYRRVVE